MAEMKKILGWDFGYSSSKITYGYSDGQIIKRFKFPSLIGVTKKLECVEDARIYEYKEHNYYIGNDALHLPSENLIDITEYQNLEYYAPLMLAYIMDKIEDTPDVIVTGLSIAQIGNSGYFQEALKSFKVNGEQFTFSDVSVLPQGGGTKLTIDKYGDNFPVEQEDFLGESTYVLCDLGFNTLDMALVTDGKTSPNLFEGIEKEGVMKIAKQIAIKVEENFGRKITLQEAREIIDTGTYKLRGKSHSFKADLDIIKKQYMKELLQLIEMRYGKIIDKCNFISLSGGGSFIFKNTDDGFIKVPKNSNEYYNSIGFFLYGNTIQARKDLDVK